MGYSERSDSTAQVTGPRIRYDLKRVHTLSRNRVEHVVKIIWRLQCKGNYRYSGRSCLRLQIVKHDLINSRRRIGPAEKFFLAQSLNYSSL